jgi:hypothetical protein
MAEYAVTKKHVSQHTFAWWVPYNLKKQDIIIAKVNTKIPQTHTQIWDWSAKASWTGKMRLDTKNSNTFWEDAIT